MQLRHEHCGHILVLYIHVRGEFILVGDLMKSMTVLQLNPRTNEVWRSIAQQSVPQHS